MARHADFLLTGYPVMCSPVSRCHRIPLARVWLMTGPCLWVTVALYCWSVDCHLVFLPYFDKSVRQEGHGILDGTDKIQGSSSSILPVDLNKIHWIFRIHRRIFLMYVGIAESEENSDVLQRNH